MTTRPGAKEFTMSGLIALLVGASLSAMSAMIVNVAVANIQKEFSASPAAIAAVVAYYGLAHGVFLITGGRLGDLYGRRRVFTAGLAAFSTASLLCALSTSIWTLIAARVAQGVAAAVMFPQALSIIRVASVDEHQRSQAFAAFGVVLGLSAVAGPLIGGALINSDLLGTASWRMVFLVNVPVGVATVLAATVLVPESRSAATARLDFGGVVLCTAALSLLLQPLIAGRHAGWSALTVIPMIAAVPVLAAFIIDQNRKARRKASPLIDPGLFGIAIAFLFHATIVATYFVLALVLQLGLKQAAFEAALFMAPAGIAFLAASIIGNRLSPRLGIGIVLLLGCGISATGYAACAAVAISGSIAEGWGLVPALAAAGFGQGLVLPPLIEVVLGSLPKHQAGSASGIVATAQQVGGAFGVAMATIAYFDGAGEVIEPQWHAVAFGRAMLLQAGLAAAVFCLLAMLLFSRRPQAVAGHKARGIE